MQPQEPLTVALEPAPLECWDEESTASALRALAVRLHSTGISLRETAVALEEFGVYRSHQAVFQGVHRVARGSRPAAGTPAAGRRRRNSGDDRHRTAHWLYAAIDVETKLLLGVRLSERRGTDLAAVFLGQLAEKHDFSETTFLVDGMGYLTALPRCDLSGHLNHVKRNLIKNCPVST